MDNLKDSLFDRVQILILLIFSPFFLFPSLKWAWLLLIIPFLWIARKIFKKKYFESSILDWPILVLLIQVLLTCIVVPSLQLSLPKITGVVFAVAVFYALTSFLTTERSIKAGIFIFLSGGLLFSILGLLGMFTKKEKYLNLLMQVKEWLPQIHFNLPGAEKGFHPNAVGGTLILFIPLSFMLFYYYLLHNKEKSFLLNKKISVVFLLIGLSIPSIILLLTQSRTSWIGLILSCSIPLFVFFKKKKKWKAVFLLFYPAVIIISGVLYYILIGSQNLQLSLAETTIKLEYRIQALSIGLEKIIQHPLTGIGMNRMRLNQINNDPLVHVHNHFLHTAAEMGIPALIALSVILIGAGFMCIKVWKKSTIGWMRMAVLGLGWGQAAHLIFGMADCIPLGAKAGIFFWISLALITSIYNRVMNDSSQIKSMHSLSSLSE